MQELINIKQGGLSETKYTFKFTERSKFAPRIMGDSRAKINKFFMEETNLVSNECHFAMYEYFLSHGACEKTEEKLMNMNWEVKRARTDDGNFCNGMYDDKGRAKSK